MRVPVLIVVLASIAACSTPPPRPLPVDVAAAASRHQAELLPLVRWNLRGRLALRAGDSGGQAGIYWTADGPRYRIQLNGPLGRGLARLSAADGVVELIDSDDRRHTAPNAEALLHDTLGWHLPLDGLQYWVRGVEVPAVVAERALDAYGRLKHLRQLGWLVSFEEYREQQGLDLPAHLTVTRMERNGAPVQLFARLVIDEWQVPR